MAGSEERTHRDVVQRAEQQVSVGVIVDLSLSLEHLGLIVEWFDDLWLLLRAGDKNEKTSNTDRI